MDDMSAKRSNMTAQSTRLQKSGLKPTIAGRKRSSVFQRTVLDFYKKHGRNFPWRKTKDPYKILVSEIMLQQTQVTRVVDFYARFLKRFPTLQKLAESSLSAVLKEWQGLGYNRRAKMFHEAARQIVKKHRGKVPRLYSELVALPGVGDYTAKAVRTFAWNEPEMLIETNIRSAYLHHFFPKTQNVPDSKLIRYIEYTNDKKNPRVWHWSLMDYGSYLKKTMPNPSRRSAHHAPQKPFKGSDREIRGAILRALAKKSSELKALHDLPFPRKRIATQLSQLQKEGFIIRRGSRYALQD